MTSLAYKKSESAEAFARGGVDSAMRATSVDVIAALSKNADIMESERRFVREMLSAIEVQMSFAIDFVNDRTSHPYIRREVDAVWQALNLERESWLLLDTVFRSSDIRCRDLSSTRLRPDVIDNEKINSVAGMIKCKRIAEWLELVADDELRRSGGPRVKPLDDPAYRWAYTSSRLDHSAVSMDFPLVDSEGLDDTENSAEERLCRELFRLVRAGHLEEAEQVCRSVGQPWRAAILAGGKNCSTVSANGLKGNGRRTWRNAVAQMARSTSSIPPYERALYAVLSGVMPPALAVTSSYEDQAWVRITTLIDTVSETSLRGRGDQPHIADETILQAFRECEGADKGPEAIPREVLAQVRSVRAHLALGDSIGEVHLVSLLQTLASLARTGLELRLEWVCRFAAHQCLFLKLAGLMEAVIDNEEVMRHFEDAVESYPRLVVEKDLEEEDRAVQAGTILGLRPLVSELAARHLAELANTDRIVAVYSDLLCASLKADLRHEDANAQRVGVPPRDVDERRTNCLEKAGACFSRDILRALAIKAIDRVWEAHMPQLPEEKLNNGAQDVDVSAFEVMTDDDKLAIRAIEFLVFPAYPNYEEAVNRGTSAARTFFLAGKRAAARHLVEWFPSDIVAELPSGSCRAAVRELDCWRAYMEAVALHSSWSGYYFSRRPLALPDEVREAASARPGQISYEVQAAASVQFEKYVREMETYQSVARTARDAAVKALRAALLFHGGWMRDAEEDGEDAQTDDGDTIGEPRTRRDRELLAVRRIAVPQLAALLHHVLHESKLYEEATSLATVIADDTTRLYESFGKQDLRAFLRRVADSAIHLADATVKEQTVSAPYEGFFFEELT